MPCVIIIIVYRILDNVGATRDVLRGHNDRFTCEGMSFSLFQFPEVV